MRLIGILLFLVSNPLLAQYKGPAVESCLSYAKREIERDGTRAKDVVFDQDQNLSLDRYSRKLGNQPVSSILTGNGAVVLAGTPSAELSFICLLADEKRAVFFNWLPRRNPSAFLQCTRDEALRKDPAECLKTLLVVAENDLTQVYASAFHEARQRDGTGEEAHTDVFRKANDEWKRYRDAECARQRDAAPQGARPESRELACRVDLTRRRIVDMR
jgi:uncharacterized protein YecT (DUF1311 family)